MDIKVKALASLGLAGTLGVILFLTLAGDQPIFWFSVFLLGAMAVICETLGEKMDQYIEERRHATGFDLRYNDTIRPTDDAWRDCAAVLARRDLDNLMRQGWGG